MLQYKTVKLNTNNSYRKNFINSNKNILQDMITYKIESYTDKKNKKRITNIRLVNKKSSSPSLYNNSNNILISKITSLDTGLTLQEKKIKTKHRMVL